MDPLAFVYTKKNLKLDTTKFNKSFDLRFDYGKLSVIDIHSYSVNFRDVKETIEKKYGKKLRLLLIKKWKKRDYFNIRMRKF